MAANPEIILLKHSSQDLTLVEEAIAPGGSDGITDGELVIVQEDDRAFLYTIGKNNNLVRVFTGANLNPSNNWSISEDGGDFDTGSASSEQFFLPDVNQPFHIVYQTSPVAGGNYSDFSMITGKMAYIMEISSNHPAWIRVYGTAEARTADNRTSPGGTLPVPGSDFHAEVVTTPAAGTITMSPVAIAHSPDSNVRIRLRNLSTESRSFVVTLKILSLTN
jgi:hypothetical protein